MSLTQLQKMERNYFTVPDDHCHIEECIDHEWWCRKHLKSNGICDCVLEVKKQPILKIDMKLPKNIKKYTSIDKALVWDSGRQTYKLMDI